MNYTDDLFILVKVYMCWIYENGVPYTTESLNNTLQVLNSVFLSHNFVLTWLEIFVCPTDYT